MEKCEKINILVYRIYEKMQELLTVKQITVNQCRLSCQQDFKKTFGIEKTHKRNRNSLENKSIFKNNQQYLLIKTTFKNEQASIEILNHA